MKQTATYTVNWFLSNVPSQYNRENILINIIVTVDSHIAKKNEPVSYLTPYKKIKPEVNYRPKHEIKTHVSRRKHKIYLQSWERHRFLEQNMKSITHKK